MKHTMQPTINERPLGNKQAAGVALFTCLMILLVLSLLGITAMRMMSGQAQMAAGSLGSELSYSTGVSAINAAIQVAEGDVDRTLLPNPGDAPRVVCLSGKNATVTLVDCSDADAQADKRGVARAQVTISTINTDNDPADVAAARLAERINRFGSTLNNTVQPEYFTFTSVGGVDALGIEVTQSQETYLPILKN